MRYAKLGSGSARHRLRALFDLLRGPAATSAAAAVRWQGLLLTVIDGTTMSVADAVPVIAGGYGKQRCNHGGSGYPGLRLSLLLTCGTRSVIDATFDPITTGELDQARTLARSLHAGMLLLADRNYAAADLIKTLAATKADLLIRCKTAAACRSSPATATDPGNQRSAPPGSGSSTRRSPSEPPKAPAPATTG